MSEGPNSNLVFLLDVSGSMNSSNKLPLLKDAFTMLADQMRSDDRVAIVVYAGAAGVVLPSTSFDDKKTILKALDNLRAGGSTAGGAGIKLAYKIAKENYIDGGNNRIILATDGDFNVGASSDGEMVRLIEEKRKSGIFLTVLGFGMGNYKDSKMEKLADKGNGNYAYIDNLMEAKKVLVNEISGTLFAIAKDVKVQIEFNPAKIKSYRLIGYENRLLAAEDFNDDTKDAGELGAGHTVTAIYEIIPVESAQTLTSNVDPLKYQSKQLTKTAVHSGEWVTIKLRYKPPTKNKSLLLKHVVTGQDLYVTGNNFRFSAAVAYFGMMLRQSKFITEDFGYQQTIDLAKSGKGLDSESYRAECIELMERAAKLN